MTLTVPLPADDGLADSPTLEVSHLEVTYKVRGTDRLTLRDESAAHIMFVEILPNVLGPVLVEFTVRLGYAIFAVATLSFLGFGVQPPTPDWGADIAANYGLLAAGYWWETLFPALAIASLIIAVNLISDSIEAVLIQ